MRGETDKPWKSASDAMTPESAVARTRDVPQFVLVEVGRKVIIRVIVAIIVTDVIVTIQSPMVACILVLGVANNGINRRQFIL